MRLILAQYLRTLKERYEFDRLLPDLLLAMGYVPISKPQTGNRQHGVDLAAVGTSPEDGAQELLLLVIKQDDIGRSNWDSGNNSVRQSLNEVLDVYLKTHIEPAHAALRKRIVLTTTGDLKQVVQINWDNYAQKHSDEASFSFWGGDQIAVFIEQHMLNEYIFDTEDRAHLRKALALAGEPDYDQKDLYRLFHRQLGLTDEGELVDSKMRSRDLVKALRVVTLASQIFARWSEDEGNLKQALIAMERAVLWSWHRIQKDDEANKKRFFEEFSELWQGYHSVARRYFEKLQGHFYVKDGLSGYCRESAEFSLVIFEHIGLIASIGLCQVFVVADEDIRQTSHKNASIVAKALVSLLENNPASGSPILDSNVIDITLGFLLLVSTGHTLQAQNWLQELVKRIDYTFKLKRNFPICTDSTDDLVDVTVFDDEELRTSLMSMSWLLPTLAAWALILDRDDLYSVIAKNSKTDYPEVCLQLWHPTQDLHKHLYYQTAPYLCGEAEAPVHLPETPDEFRHRMLALLKSDRHNTINSSPASNSGIPALDLVACRHFRTPVAPFFLSLLLKTTNISPPEQINDGR